MSDFRPDTGQAVMDIFFFFRLTCSVALCGFGGQCFGLEKSHGGISVVECVLMNEIR